MKILISILLLALSSTVAAKHEFHVISVEREKQGLEPLFGTMNITEEGIDFKISGKPIKEDLILIYHIIDVHVEMEQGIRSKELKETISMLP